MRIPSVMSVFPASGKLGLAPVLHTLNDSFDFGAEGSASISPAILYRGARSFLMPLLCVGPSAQRRHRHVKIVDMSDQSKRTTLLILVRCVLALLS